MKVLVIGTGTIGLPFANILLALLKIFGILEVIVHKNTPTPQDVPMIQRLVKRGAKLCVHSDQIEAFKKGGLSGSDLFVFQRSAFRSRYCRRLYAGWYS